MRERHKGREKGEGKKTNKGKERVRRGKKEGKKIVMSHSKYPYMNC